MNITGFDKDSLAFAEREIISVHLEQDLSLQQHEKLGLLMPMRVQDVGSGRKLDPVSSERKHHIAMYTVFFEQTLGRAVHSWASFC
ncbi:hypothetical protein D3C79_983400 [compost metagenome]